MNISDFFDPYNMDHIEAYHHLCQTGMWPKGFIPEELKLEFESSWQFIIMNKLAEAWVGHMLTIDVG